jgi:LysM repeat protein
MRTGPRSRFRTWLALAITSFTLAGCFQTARDAIMPTPVGVSTIATLPVESPTPFVTPLPNGGFSTPTEDLNTLLTLTAAVPPEASTPTGSAPVVFPSQTPEVSLPVGESTLTPVSPETGSTIVAPTLPPTPALLSTPTALPTEGPCVHTVQPGEWLFAIARKYNINPEDLKAANPALAGRYDALQPGDVLNIPNCNQQATATAAPPTSVPANQFGPGGETPTGQGPAPTPIPLTDRIYTVAPGDTLGAIARKFGITVQALKEANGLTSDALAVGQQLKIPKPQP